MGKKSTDPRRCTFRDSAEKLQTAMISKLTAKFGSTPGLRHTSFYKTIYHGKYEERYHQQFRFLGPKKEGKISLILVVVTDEDYQLDSSACYQSRGENRGISVTKACPMHANNQDRKQFKSLTEAEIGTLAGDLVDLLVKKVDEMVKLDKDKAEAKLSRETVVRLCRDHGVVAGATWDGEIVLAPVGTPVSDEGHVYGQGATMLLTMDYLLSPQGKGLAEFFARLSEAVEDARFRYSEDEDSLPPT